MTSGLLMATTERLLQRPDLGSLIPSYLLLLHQMIRASVPLMEAACREAKRAGDDAVNSRLAAYLLNHIEEERHHDAWTLEDLASIGFVPAQMLEIPPSTNVASLVGAQYYWILHHHPLALLGYIAILEGNAPSISLVDELVDRTGLPKSAFRTLRLHATADPDHQIDLNRLIDALPANRHHDNLIAVSAAHTGAYFARCLSNLKPLDRNVV